jgi:hypothetical protein
MLNIFETKLKLWNGRSTLAHNKIRKPQRKNATTIQLMFKFLNCFYPRVQKSWDQFRRIRSLESQPQHRIPPTRDASAPAAKGAPVPTTRSTPPWRHLRWSLFCSEEKAASFCQTVCQTGIFCLAQVRIFTVVSCAEPQFKKTTTNQRGAPTFLRVSSRARSSTKSQEWTPDGWEIRGREGWLPCADREELRWKNKGEGRSSLFGR